MTTPTDRVLEKLDAMAEDLGTLKTDVAVVKSKLPDVTQQAADHEKRIRSLEARLWYALGAVGILAFIVPLVQTYLFTP